MNKQTRYREKKSLKKLHQALVEKDSKYISLVNAYWETRKEQTKLALLINNALKRERVIVELN